MIFFILYSYYSDSKGLFDLLSDSDENSSGNEATSVAKGLKSPNRDTAEKVYLFTIRTSNSRVISYPTKEVNLNASGAQMWQETADGISPRRCFRMLVAKIGKNNSLKSIFEANMITLFSGSGEIHPSVLKKVFTLLRNDQLSPDQEKAAFAIIEYHRKRKTMKNNTIDYQIGRLYEEALNIETQYGTNKAVTKLARQSPRARRKGYGKVVEATMRTLEKLKKDPTKIGLSIHISNRVHDLHEEVRNSDSSVPISESDYWAGCNSARKERASKASASIDSNVESSS